MHAKKVCRHWTNVALDLDKPFSMGAMRFVTFSNFNTRQPLLQDLLTLQATHMTFNASSYLWRGIPRPEVVVLVL
jgi:hypothetical protein